MPRLYNIPPEEIELAEAFLEENRGRLALISDGPPVITRLASLDAPFTSPFRGILGSLDIENYEHPVLCVINQRGETRRMYYPPRSNWRIEVHTPGQELVQPNMGWE